MESSDNQSQGAAILKELSDIKASLAVNTNETANIKSNMAEIKGDIKEIKNDFVSRREFNEALKEIRIQISPLRKILYGMIGVVGVAVLGAILRLVLIR
jgi:hypothetical protein